MSNTYGKNLKITVFGQSHSAAIGVTVEGLPSGFCVDGEKLQRFLDRRAPGKNEFSTARKETDTPEFLSGLKGGVTCGAPLTAIIRNGDTRPGDYETFRRVPRPGHADFTAYAKFGASFDASGGGQFSGRLTAPICIAGGICLQLLETRGISVFARALEIGGVADEGALTESLAEKAFPTVSDAAGEQMRARIAEARAEGDSVGGIVECVVTGLPAGVGEPMFGGMENRIAEMVFGIPAVKGIEFGAGFALARMTGSEANDAFAVQDGKVVTETNRCGGVLGGITTGMPLTFRAAIKPTPSIAKPQKSVNLETMEEQTLTVQGRHDPCIVPRAVPVVEAAAAIAVCDALMEGDTQWI